MAVVSHPNDASLDTSRIATKLADVDVHGHVIGGITGVYPYMPAGWRSHFQLKTGSIGAETRPGALTTGSASLTLRFTHPTNLGLRTDAAAEPGGLPASDPRFVAQDLLDRHGISVCLVNSLESATYAAALAGPDESNVICSAYNDYFLERWTEQDSRFRYALCVSPQDPEAAVREIERRHSHPGVAAVFVPVTNILLGHRHYFPVFRAAQEHGLPIFTHLSGAEGVFQGAPVPTGGLPETFLERRVGYPLYGQANLISLVFSGALTTFPDLKFAFVEYGFTWLLTLLWRMDSSWQHMRLDAPFLTERPSHYIERQVRFATQPFDEPAEPRDLKKLLAMFDPKLLMFSTDYPHWDGDSPDYVLKALAPEARASVAYDNAAEWFAL
jgi:predicted TIM-barrel fold metal-dependent hydrolase